MANDYHDILIEHIEALMRERNISQADIIRGTGIPQPQMSKALNRTKGNLLVLSYNPIASSSSCSLHEMSRQLLLDIQLSWFILGSHLTSSNY